VYTLFLLRKADDALPGQEKNAGSFRTRDLNETQPKIPKVEIFYKEIGENGRNQMIRRNLLDGRDVSNPS
jgi:hypothetical protein